MGSTLKAELSNWIVFIGFRWEGVIATIVMGSHHQILVSRMPFHSDLEVMWLWCHSARSLVL